MEHSVRCAVLVLLLGICLGQHGDIEGRNGRRDASYGRPVLAMANSPRCTFNGKPVEDGTFVSSPEPCLNCSCSRGILLCYLHTCNSIVAVPGCEIAKKPGACCPHLECKEPFGYNEYRTERTNEPGYRYKLRQEDANLFGLVYEGTETPPTRKPYAKGNGPNYSSFLKGLSPNRRSDPDAQAFYVQEEDEAEDELSPDRNDSYCFSRGRKYAEGTAMLSPTKCEYCYCIRGQQMCVRPKCHLTVDGCVPRYQSGYTCCPSHYNCDVPANGSQPVTEDSDALLSNKVSSCNVEGHDFEVGVAVPSNGHCQTCYCTQIGVVCRRLECSPRVPGCTPVIPEGHCCPTQYKCDPSTQNNTQGPISHSTDNYDVTVLSPSDGDGARDSSTEDPGVTSETGMERAGTETELPETPSTTSSEKHKITVELSEEADLESISVIPEENIAVLVLTTEKEHEDDEKDETDEVADETVPREDTTVNQESSTFHHGRRKAKPTKSTDHFKNKEQTQFSTLKDNLVPSTVSHEETVKYPEEGEKDAYAYEYGEYEDVTPDVKQTYSAFSDYSPPEYTDTVSTLKESTTLKGKVKYNTPCTSGTTKLDTRTTKSESMDSTTEINRPTFTIPSGQTRYSIYSTDRTQTWPSITESLVTKQKLAQKHRRPGIITKHHQTKFSTRPTDFATSTEVNEDRTAPYESTKTDATYLTETQTHRTKVRTTPPTHKKASNRRRLPEGAKQSTLPLQTPQPIPQDLADFLWSITQLQNAQTQATSTERVDTTKDEESGTQNYSPETLPPIAVAAPKLILEESTPGGIREDLQTETTRADTNPPSPNFNFQQPEIIFSNHGPSYKERPDVPLLINNHKKTSTRLRPPIRPQTTPSLEDTFVEISNHRPSNTNKRPLPGKFPPYPHKVNRPDAGYNRDPHIRDPHVKLHRNEPDVIPENDYEEYYYDSDRDRQTTTTMKVFNNIHSTSTTKESTWTADTNPPTTTKDEAQTFPVTISDYVVTEIQVSTKLPSTTAKNSINKEEIIGRSSEETTEDVPADTEKTDTATTPQLKTTSVLTTTTTTASPVDIHTTKSFSGYVTNKYKGTSSFVNNGEAKHFRAEDNSKGREKGFIGHRQNEGRPSHNFPSYPEKPAPIPPAINITQPQPASEDSQEISDVCFVDGRYYTSGELIVKSNPCEMCKCFYGHPLCQVQQCPTPPGPSCVLEYLPGYCCPSVTCGITDTEQLPDIVTAPEPTSQEIKPPHIKIDNQWKPLPHGPILRTTERPHKTEPEEKPQETEMSEQKTAPLQPNEPIISLVEKDAIVEESHVQKQQITTTSSTTEQPSPSTTSEPTTQPPPTTDHPSTTTPEAEEPTTLPMTPEPSSGPRNKSEIHDNSSGVRKTLDSSVTLPPSKVVLSSGNSSDISTVLPVIVTQPPTTTTEDLDESGIELVTIPGIDLGQSTDLGGNLKVSGCNVYGKYYKINDKVTALSKPCSECICSADGISCNATC